MKKSPHEIVRRTRGRDNALANGNVESGMAGSNGNDGLYGKAANEASYNQFERRAA